MQSMTSHVVVVLMLSVSSLAQGSGEYAEVSSDKVRVRGGPADLHAVLGLMKKGSVVRVVGEDGPWRRVEVPGGVPTWVAKRHNGREYLQTPKPGEGIVLVNDLMIRGTPNTDYPPIGRLNAGERVLVLDENEAGDWARLLSPDGTRTWIHGRLLERSSDQVAAAVAWKARHTRSRRLLLESGALSKQFLLRDDKERGRADAATRAFNRYEEQRKQAWDRRDTAALRKELAQVREEAPAGHGDRLRAEMLLKSLDDWESTAKTLAEAKGRFREAEVEAKRAEDRYAGSLQELREALKARAEKAAGAGTEPRSPYRAQGYVRRATPPTGIGNGPHFALTMGGKTWFLLESERYDMGDFAGKLIGVLVADAPETRPDLDARVMKVARIEILDG